MQTDLGWSWTGNLDFGATYNWGNSALTYYWQTGWNYADVAQGRVTYDDPYPIQVGHYGTVEMWNNIFPGCNLVFPSACFVTYDHINTFGRWNGDLIYDGYSYRWGNISVLLLTQHIEQRRTYN